MGYQKRQFIVVFILGFTGLLILKFFRDILSDPYYEIFGIIFCLIIASSPLIFYFLDSNKDKGWVFRILPIDRHLIMKNGGNVNLQDVGWAIAYYILIDATYYFIFKTGHSYTFCYNALIILVLIFVLSYILVRLLALYSLLIPNFGLDNNKETVRYLDHKIIDNLLESKEHFRTVAYLFLGGVTFLLILFFVYFSSMVPAYKYLLVYIGIGLFVVTGSGLFINRSFANHIIFLVIIKEQFACNDLYGYKALLREHFERQAKSVKFFSIIFPFFHLFAFYFMYSAL